ncbi:hypothetical protein [Streptomyces sp. HPF1205]|uniref:hypothetical protein n=1 Tax=Streptomyces sp. HPF1205 TaxID=2873262 RepID=UPI001CEC9697|nr:hypothetical protein [Streptomyces sp. HPF1205]
MTKRKCLASRKDAESTLPVLVKAPSVLRVKVKLPPNERHHGGLPGAVAQLDGQE